MKAPAIIETERLILRKPAMQDVQAVFSGWAQDPEVTRFLTWRPHRDISQTEAMLAKAIAAWDGDARFPYMITMKEGGGVLGMIDLRLEYHRVELGYVMNQVFQGRGLMTESVLAVVQWALKQPAIYRVYATTGVDNLASQRVMEKAGMQREGLLRRYIVHPNISDQPRDSYMYAIVK